MNVWEESWTNISNTIVHVMYTQHVTRGKNPQKVFTLVWDQNIIHGLCSGYRHRGYSTGMLLFH